MDEGDLNKNDHKLLGFCFHRKKTLSDISRHLGITLKNVSIRIDRLKKLNLIETTTSTIDRRKVFVRTIEGNKINKYYSQLLEGINKKGGIISYDDYFKLLPFELGNEKDSDKDHALQTMMYTHPQLVETVLRITDKGNEFLKEYKKISKD